MVVGAVPAMACAPKENNDEFSGDSAYTVILGSLVITQANQRLCVVRPDLDTRKHKVKIERAEL